jgi:PAS domain S-box-containing protein
MMHFDPSTFYDEPQASFPSMVNSPDAFVAIDYDFNFLFLNHTAELFYKMDKNEIIGKSVQEVFPKEWDFGPFKNLRVSVIAKKQVEIHYNSPFANAWVQLVGRPFENYYTFTYRMIDHKEVLRKELRKEVGRK